jgi:hypothetical protein
MRVENTYDDQGRPIRQVTHFPDRQDPYVSDYVYQTDGDAILQADVTNSDGTWRRFTYGRNRAPLSEAWGTEGVQSAVVTYERDPRSNAITRLTLVCPDRGGRMLRHSRYVPPGHEERIKRDLLRTHCSWS